jgi:DNA-directed RNA polymerase subunit RPC12/RpoP
MKTTYRHLVDHRRLTHRCNTCGALRRFIELMSGIVTGTIACEKCGSRGMGWTRVHPPPKKERKGGRWRWMNGVRVLSEPLSVLPGVPS